MENLPPVSLAADLIHTITNTQKAVGDLGWTLPTDVQGEYVYQIIRIYSIFDNKI